MIKANSEPLGIDVDINSCTLFWSDRINKGDKLIGNIYSLSLIDRSAQTIHSDLGHPIQVAVNWITQKLYWCDNVLSTIEYSDFDGGNRQKLLGNIDGVQAIALDPCADHIYWISKENNNYAISRMKLDGTSREVVVAKYVQTPNSLVIDPVSSKLYWADHYTIKTSNLEGGNVSITYTTESRRPISISLYDNILCWGEWRFDWIYTCTTDGTKVGALVKNVKRSSAIHIMDRSRQSSCCE